jgi:hypothetical protein
VVAGEYFGADHLLAAVRPEHQAFYVRSFGSKVLCEARPYPPLLKPITLTTVHFPTQGAELYRRYPFYRSTPADRRKLFERPRSAHTASAERPDSRLSPPSQGAKSPFVVSAASRLAG